MSVDTDKSHERHLDKYELCRVPASAGYWAQDGRVTVPDEFHGGMVFISRAVWVENKMSRECRYDKRDEDPRCPIDCERR